MNTALCLHVSQRNPFARPLLLKSTCYYLLSVLCLFLSAAVPAQDRLVGLTSSGGQNGGGTSFNILSNGTGFSIKASFLNAGQYPYGNLIKGSDGAFYGTTSRGGIYNGGTIFKITASGSITVLKHLNYNTTGSNARGGLFQGRDGNFYGTTSDGGMYAAGTIFKITPTGVLTVLKHTKYDDTSGFHPYGSLVQGTDGYFYGMMGGGGLYNYGTIYKIDSTGKSFAVLRHLDYASGGYPYGSLLLHSDGYFYGMTNYGGSGGYGTIFKINAAGGNWTILKNLDGFTTGGQPQGSLVKGTDGLLYGMTKTGGTNKCGTIFKINTTGTFTLLKNFDYNATGANPNGSLVQGADGYFYGMTYYGGLDKGGAIFKINSTGSNFIVLKNLSTATDATTGYYPQGGLIQASDGAFYGMVTEGNSYAWSFGSIFKITSTGTYTVLFHFPDNSKGFGPQGSLFQATDGSFYGMALYGGLYNQGSLIKLCSTGSYTLLHSFKSADCSAPKGDLVQGSDGNFYGLTFSDSTQYGAVFKMSPSGAVTIIKRLDNATGTNPYGSLIQGSDGYFYGMTNSGGSVGYGTIFKVNSTGSSFVVLKDFDGTTTGGWPYGTLVKGSDGYLYGMTSYGGTYNSGTIFKLNTTGTSFTVLKYMDNSSGTMPHGTLIQCTDGYFYGMTAYGGTNDSGTIFKINSTGTTFSVLKYLNAATGSYGNGKGAMVQGSDGSLYGLTSQGGTYNAGTIFKVTTTGAYTVLRHLNLETDGGSPYGSLIIQKANPKAVGQSVTTKEDSLRTIVLSGTGGTPLSYAVSTAPKNGTLSGTGSTRIYTPKPNFNGRDSFYFKVTWGCQTSSSAKVVITVAQVNDTPVLAPIGNKTVAKGASLKFTATATDMDSGQSKTFSLLNAPTGATIGAATGAFSWTPTITGTYTFTIRVTDNGSPALYDQEKITVTVTTTGLMGSMTGRTQGQDSLFEEPFTAMATPNPSASSFTLVLHSTRTEAARLKVFDELGQLVEKKVGIAANQTMHLGLDYRPGTYMVEVQQGSEKTYVKLVKQ